MHRAFRSPSARQEGAAVVARCRDSRTDPYLTFSLRSSQESGITRDWVLHDLLAPDGFAAALAVEQEMVQQC